MKSSSIILGCLAALDAERVRSGIGEKGIPIWNSISLKPELEVGSNFVRSITFLVSMLFWYWKSLSMTGLSWCCRLEERLVLCGRGIYELSRKNLANNE